MYYRWCVLKSLINIKSNILDKLSQIDLKIGFVVSIDVCLCLLSLWSTLPRLCNPTPTANPHPINKLLLVFKRKSQTFLQTSCSVSMELYVYREDTPVHEKLRVWEEGVWFRGTERQKRSGMVHGMLCGSEWLLRGWETEVGLGWQRGQTGETQVTTTQAQWQEGSIVEV